MLFQALQACRLPGWENSKTPKIPGGSFHHALWRQAFAVPALQPAVCLHIAISCSGVQACCLPGLKNAKTPKTLQFPRGSFHQALWPSAFAAPGLQPALCLHIPRGSFHQALWPQAFAVPALQPAVCLHIAVSCSGVEACRLPGLKPLKPLKRSKIPRGSFHQAVWPSALAAPGLQPALCLHIPRGSFHQALWPQAFAVPALQPAVCLHIAVSCSGVEACRLPGLKKPKTPKIHRGSFHQAVWPQAFATIPSRQLPPSTLAVKPLLFHRCSLPFAWRLPRGSFHQACPLPAYSHLLFGRSSLPFARLQTLKTPKTLQLLQGCSLPFACTSLAAASTKLLAVSVPALQPALCLHTALSC